MCERQQRCRAGAGRPTPTAARAGSPAALALAVVAALSGCQSASGPTPQTAAKANARVDPALSPAAAGLLSLLPPSDQLPKGSAGLIDLINEAADLLSVEPPVQPELREPSDPTDERVREKIEAYFESGLRWQDGLRVRAVDLIGALIARLSSGADPVLAQALAALVLEDLAALGFDAAGSHHAPSFDLSPERIPVAMVSAEVMYSGLSAQLYAYCHAAALASGAPAWARFCEQGRHGMLVLSEDLPACTAPSISSASAPDLLSAPEPRAPTRAGLLLQGAFFVPLLESELSLLVASVHDHLGQQLELPLLPLSELPSNVASESGPSCSHPVRPSRAFVSAHPNTRWYGMFLECAEHHCSIGVCGDGLEGGCLRAPVQGDPARVSSWQHAIAQLAPAEGGVLLESSGEILPEQPRVALDEVRLFGTWREPDLALQAIGELPAEFLQCQSGERYSGHWVLDLGPDGQVVGVRAENDRFLLPMDQVLADPSQQRCIADRFSAIQLSRAPRAATRRVVLALRIPAQLHVDVPFTVRHDGRLGPLEEPERLGRDAFAVNLARCAAQVEPQLATMGLCMSLSPNGRIEGLTVDPNPDRRARVFARLQQPAPPSTLSDSKVQACLSQALSNFEWTCREAGSGPGHLAMTVDLPRGLVARFDK